MRVSQLLLVRNSHITFRILTSLERDRKDTVHEALFVSFVNDYLFRTFRGGGVCGFALCRHGGGWIHGNWRLGKDVPTLWKGETVSAQRCLWRNTFFYFHFHL